MIQPADQPADQPAGHPLTAHTLAAALTELALPFQREGERAYLVTLSGQHKRQICVRIILGCHEVVLECFVCRAVESDQQQTYAFLLRRNTFLRVLRYSLDKDGDIFLTARIARTAFTEGELDTLLGSVLSCVEEDFNRILALGYADAIRREWAWRKAHQQSTANLTVFQDLITGPE